MTQLGPRFWEIFFEVYEPLPRQGPGNLASAAMALGLCRELKESPAIIDLGCGASGQTLQLAELTSGPIVAIDSHAPSIERLQAAVAERGLLRRVTALVGDMGLWIRTHWALHVARRSVVGRFLHAHGNAHR